ncbi:hypothetical protein COLO4_29502 [Corchorus olitorius]|uniref:Uncharacterized protein n=1 Tax=Corchorus olitorius TaxID=93759 RepID=A0A1R3HE73_9ROSI|nr:hypothetical protein COLO4_29502 [Corchorus olitorius]
MKVRFLGFFWVSIPCRKDLCFTRTPASQQANDPRLMNGRTLIKSNGKGTKQGKNESYNRLVFPHKKK